MKNRPGEDRAGGQGRATDPATPLTTERLWTEVPFRSSPAAHVSASLTVRRPGFSDPETRLRLSGSGTSGAAGGFEQGLVFVEDRAAGSGSIIVEDWGGATSAPVKARAFQVRAEFGSGWGR